MDDAVALALHYMLEHLERPGTYVRVLFIDFSSAFNTIIPFKLFDKLAMLNIHPTICHWILDFLLHRSQSVRVNGSISSPVIINTGGPQGCVLSPFLFTLFTNDCVSGDQSVRLIKFSDDATLIGCIENADETAYREEVQRMVDWCGKNNLVLNVSKTREMTIDFRKHKNPMCQLLIDNTVVKQVESFKFLGSTISSDLSWGNNTASMVKRGQQRMYFLRQLKKFGISPIILKRFYHAIIESVLTFSITVWFGRASYEEKAQLETLVRGASKIIGLTLPTIESVYQTRCVHKSKKIVRDATHPANHLFELLKSGKRYRSVKAKTMRF